MTNSFRGVMMSNTTARIVRAGKPRKCPECGFAPVATIQYGFPVNSLELNQAIDEGRKILGGCCVTDDDPAWECSRCGLQIYRRERFPVPIEDLKA